MFKASSSSPRRILFAVPFVLALALVALEGAGQAAGPEAKALLRVELEGPIEELGIPAYAHLQGTAGEEYVLTLAAPSEASAAGLSFTVIDAEAAPEGYLIGLERRPGGRAAAVERLGAVLDDGRRVVVRAGGGRAAELQHLGLQVSRLPEQPLVLRRAAPAMARAVARDEEVATMIGEARQAFVHKYDGQLSGEEPVNVGGVDFVLDTRATDSGAPIDVATQFVYEHMLAQGLATTYHPWGGGAGLAGRNVVGELPGAVRPEEVVLLTAHLDSRPYTGEAPGADDNASGSTAVMIASEILARRELERTVRFIFFTGEEQGLFGSRAYAAKMAAAGENLVAVLNLDMISWNSDDAPVLRLHTRPESNPGYGGDLSIAELFIDVVETYGLAGSLEPVLEADGITASDHSPFWTRGYPAILGIEDDVDDFNPNWHRASDRRETLDLPYFTAFVKAGVGTVAHLAIPTGSAPAATLPRPNRMRARPLTSSSVELAWNDRSAGGTSFQIASRTPSSPWRETAVAGAGAESFVVTGLDAGGTYSFRVRARRGAAASGWSNRATVTLPMLTRPNQLRATALSATEVRLEWNDRSAGESSFDVDLRGPSGSWTRVTAVGADVSRAVLSGLAPGATYSFRVRARKGGAASSWSNRADIVLPEG